MSEYSEKFSPELVKRSSEFCAPAAPVDPRCPKPEPKPRTLPADLCKLVTNVCVAQSNSDGKFWLVQNCIVWDDKAECWVESSEGIRELPALYKAGSVLPSFDGALDVILESGETAQAFGGSALPEDMLGAVICIDGVFCYFGDAPLPEIPEEIQTNGDAPALESGVKLWISNGVHKTRNDEGFWVQSTAFGAQ